MLHYETDRVIHSYFHLRNRLSKFNISRLLFGAEPEIEDFGRTDIADFLAPPVLIFLGFVFLSCGIQNYSRFLMRTKPNSVMGEEKFGYCNRFKRNGSILTFEPMLQPIEEVIEQERDMSVGELSELSLDDVLEYLMESSDEDEDENIEFFPRLPPNKELTKYNFNDRMFEL